MMADPTNLYVKGIPRECDEAAVKQLFESYGEVVSVGLMKNSSTDGRPLVALVRMGDAVQAQNAIAMLNGISMGNGFTLMVELSKSPKGAGKGKGGAPPSAPLSANRYTPYTAKPVQQQQQGNSQGVPSYVELAQQAARMAQEALAQSQQAQGQQSRNGHSHAEPGSVFRLSPSFIHPLVGPMKAAEKLGDPRANLHVYNVPNNSEDALLYRLFSPYGALISTALFANKAFGFVKFANFEDAQRAIEQLNGIEVGGRIIEVSVHKPKPAAPGQAQAAHGMMGPM